MNDALVPPDIPALIERMYTQEFQPYPVRSIWASQIGHPCARYLVYHQAEWQRAAALDASLRKVFMLGNMHGKQLQRDIEDALASIGYSADQAEVALPDNPWNISGKIDLVMKIPIDGARPVQIPIEMKSMAQHSWEQNKCIEDLRQAQRVYLRCYPDQILSYAMLWGAPYGMLVLRNKTNGKDRALTVYRNEERWAELTAKADVVNASLEKYRSAKNLKDKDPDRALPKRIKWSHNTCGECPFLHICIPDMSQRPGRATVDWRRRLGARLL